MFKMEDSMCSTNCKFKDFDSVAEVECSSEDISWSLFTEDFITSSIIDDSAVCSGAQSSYSVKKMCPNDDRIAPAGSISKRRKTRVPVVDHDLEDTACSPVCSSKVQNWEHSYMQLLETEYGLNTLPQEHLYQNDYRSFSQGRKTTSDKTEAVHLGFTGKDIIYTGLRKKGLCLLPVSMLFNFS